MQRHYPPRYSGFRGAFSASSAYAAGAAAAGWPSAPACGGAAANIAGLLRRRMGRARAGSAVRLCAWHLL